MTISTASWLSRKVGAPGLADVARPGMTGPAVTFPCLAKSARHGAPHSFLQYSRRRLFTRTSEAVAFGHRLAELLTLFRSHLPAAAGPAAMRAGAGASQTAKHHAG